ncbi:Multidrug resistance protein MexA [Paraburkholderia domus]|uniref:Multidrug resistance protein MexA n=1 Tax=Paraburkholderia domus TaxID=2793075 RepID=A0A9N8N547_9BURK|nr:efflux RND transporter periplasmic adaptor subunit [Paraburkholderia domus]MBK5053274.1 efflux RND transporter periplasmic adaptor subunit [Burkholderia sp. R-70006]MBK5065205.1 efflux RND transporter periplasmic adaptor subunit [Burkholderia sp. R-70199]MBK5090030.1 efflux RND transporter periplasmic adaptor subunit [Burkholderia sp. R-69927]MBK5124632.1 efflux RND transporter periplasmic adaptor subunit [Burkholderia sp. R-69980]MBK5169082.1 efflux RND transporter periplasmic adaptor subu
MRQQSHRYARPARLRRAAFALALAGIVTLAACSKKEAAAPAPRPVVAVAVHADGSATAAASLPGEVQARYSTPLSFRVGGKIIERRVRLGDVVKNGQIVARLDPADAQKNAASAQAQLDAAQHSLVYAKQQLDRDQAQAKENLIAPAQLEQTTNAYASAAAQRDQAAQQAALSKDQLQYTTLVADHAGVITAEQADTGQNVSAGQAVYNLAWSGDIDVVCDVPESALAALSVGQTAKVTLAALPGRSFNARVRELSPAADPQSRTYRAKLTLDNPGPDVRLGMTADIALSAPSPSDSSANSSADQSGSFTVPATALFHDGTQPAVWVVRAADNALELRRVTVTRYNERTIVIGQGLKDGERVVLQGVHTVTAGEKVHVIPPLHPEDFAS